MITSLLRYALDSKTVDVALVVEAREGYRFDSVLSIVKESSEIKEPIGAFHCATPNIAKFIKNYLDGARDLKVAVVVKPCDARAIIELAKRNQINLENVLMIGVNCTGTFSPTAFEKILREEFGVDPSSVVYEDIEGDSLIIELENGEQRELNLRELEERGLGRRENCRRCDVKIPRMADLAVGKWGVENDKASLIEVCTSKGAKLLEEAVRANAIVIEKPSEEALRIRDEKVEEAVASARYWQEKALSELSRLSPKERLAHWFRYLDKCVKCFGCRDACPICYCVECYLEPTRGLVPPGEIPPSKLFPLVRLAHVADSCVNCGQCEDVCMADIPLSKLTFILNKQLQEVFHYVPGVSVEEMPPLTVVTDEELLVDLTTALFEKR